MPTYVYRCAKCASEIEQDQGITEDPIKDCPGCGEPELRRIIPKGVGISFKGGGFYSTDNVK